MVVLGGLIACAAPDPIKHRTGTAYTLPASTHTIALHSLVFFFWSALPNQCFSDTTIPSVSIVEVPLLSRYLMPQLAPPSYVPREI